VTERPARVLVVGLGVMGSHHLRVLHALDDVAVAGAVDPDPERLAAAERAYGGLRTFATLAEALDAGPADAVCLAAPVPELPGLASEAVAAGVAVLVEKPLAPTEEEARAVVEEAERAGAALGVGLVERFNPAVVELRRRLEAGELGEVIQLHARRLSPFPDRDSNLGAALDLATHDIDLMRWLTGDEVLRLFAETERRRHDRGEDLVSATLRFAGGATGLLEANWLTPAKVRRLDVTGTEGMFAVNYLTQDLLFYEHPRVTHEWESLRGLSGGGEGDMVRYALNRREPLRVQWEDFLAALRAGEEPPVTGRDGLAALALARAIQRSGETGEVVDYGLTLRARS
jgi:UDP-N-acetylglucosamine 3-dehydrogenase